MCVPMNAAYADRIRAEIARGRRAAGLDAPVVRAPTPRSVRAITIDSPIGRMTFYVRERQRVRAGDGGSSHIERRVLALAA
jgi:hypothetical protein